MRRADGDKKLPTFDEKLLTRSTELVFVLDGSRMQFNPNHC